MTRRSPPVAPALSKKRVRVTNWTWGCYEREGTVLEERKDKARVFLDHDLDPVWLPKSILEEVK